MEASISPDERAERAEAALEAALAERNRLWAELNRCKAAERELEQVRRMVDEMQASPSWRLTAPLRTGKAQAQQLTALGRRAAGLLKR